QAPWPSFAGWARPAARAASGLAGLAPRPAGLMPRRLLQALGPDSPVLRWAERASPERGRAARAGGRAVPTRRRPAPPSGSPRSPARERPAARLPDRPPLAGCGRRSPADRPRRGMSRIYQDGALRNRAVRSARLPGAWDPAAHQGGPGILLEGELVDVSRHSIADAHGRKERYYVLYVRPGRVHRRKFDPQGNEIEPNFSDTRKVNTGFLMSSYKLEAKGDTDRLTAAALTELMSKPELLPLTGPLTPEQTVAFWVPEPEMEALELELGAGLRLKTRGDGPFVESLAKLEAGTVTKCNFAGDAKAGASWTDNIMARKSAEGLALEAREQGDRAEDEEWAILVFNNHGKPRLVRFYQRFHLSPRLSAWMGCGFSDIPTDSPYSFIPQPEEIQQQIVRETFHLVLKRDDNICNFLEGGSLIGGSDYKLIYRHYATLYFVFCVDSSESELGILDLIQVFVETLDKCFENVCELDLIFHMDKVHYILQEVVMGGMVLETNMNEIVAQMEAQNRLEKSEGGLSAAPARAVSAVKNINLPEIPRNISIGDLNIKVPNLSQFV
ncbi:Arpin, partial [Galemys pyrenaicus]